MVESFKFKESVAASGGNVSEPAMKIVRPDAAI
jgi:hypothetical protein